MNKHSISKWLSLILCMVLIAAVALMFTGCGDLEDEGDPQQNGDGLINGTQVYTDGATLGRGSTAFTLIVCDANGTETTLQINTDETILGKALLDLKVIAGEDSQYGLYIETVNGLTYDYNRDGKYWALYIDGEYARSGIDSTEILADATYMLKAE
ncbi:MAG: DUF4430 domain-containing protein [Oscillospiraceae bacterium]|nr:DUF4430 domain-containing protein [Oscillospiraceae bacterium]